MHCSILVITRHSNGVYVVTDINIDPSLKEPYIRGLQLDQNARGADMFLNPGERIPNCGETVTHVHMHGGSNDTGNSQGR